MGTKPETQGSSGGHAGGFRKISKPLMEKKRRARINVSLEQLKSLLEKHYSHQIRKRKLEKADILELSVKYMKSLQNSVQGLWPVPSAAEFPSGFRSCLPGPLPRVPTPSARREARHAGARSEVRPSQRSCPQLPELSSQARKCSPRRSGHPTPRSVRLRRVPAAWPLLPPQNPRPSTALRALCARLFFRK
ncbi:transcription factor HES-3 [Crocuta crocuta]